MKETDGAPGLAALLRLFGEAGSRPAGTQNATPDTPSRGDRGRSRGGDAGRGNSDSNRLTKLMLTGFMNG